MKTSTVDTQSSLLQRGDLSSTDTLGYVSIGTEEGENLITERKLGVLGKFSPHLLGGPSVSPACGNMKVIFWNQGFLNKTQSPYVCVCVCVCVYV